jgi:hypothetical protein
VNQDTLEKVTCMCGHTFYAHECIKVNLTDPERESLRSMGVDSPPSELYYCKPCWSLLNNPERASQLMKGMAQQYLQQMGVPPQEAEQKAEAYRQKLLQRAREAKDANDDTVPK